MTIQLARQIAAEAHKDQTDLAGQPYMKHVERVAEAVVMYGDETVIVALLHDVIEDGAITAGQLYEQFPADVVEAVVAITRKKQERYAAYIARVAEVSLARIVKLADLHDNISRSHQLPETQVAADRKQKYIHASMQLANAEVNAKRRSHAQG